MTSPLGPLPTEVEVAITQAEVRQGSQIITRSGVLAQSDQGPPARVTLMEAIEVDAEVRRVASAKPVQLPQANGDGKSLAAVELAARGITGINPKFSIMQLKLAAFSEPRKLAWSPPEVSLAVQVVASMPIIGHPGADW